MISWYIVQTKPWQEKKAEFFLKQKNIHVYRPKMEAHVYKGLKIVKKEKSLFPNYLFVRCEDSELYTVCWTWGVKKVLWRNDLPTPISEELVSSIRYLEDKDGLIRKSKFHELQKDQAVKIKTGPFKDLIAIFDHWDSDRERVCLLINLANTYAKIHVPISVVEPL